VLNERVVDGLVVEKFNDPLLAAYLDQRFGFGATEWASPTCNDFGL
jgi:hypothetical protein